MKCMLSSLHRKQFEEIKKDLATISAKEGNFVRIELLFYQAISLAREYGDKENENPLLASLKKIQVNEYVQTNALFKKNTQREKVIRRFITSMRTALSKGIRNGNILATPA